MNIFTFYHNGNIVFQKKGVILNEFASIDNELIIGKSPSDIN